MGDPATFIVVSLFALAAFALGVAYGRLAEIDRWRRAADGGEVRLSSGRRYQVRETTGEAGGE